MRILVTGASGFIGRALTPALGARGFDVAAPGREELGDINGDTDWSGALQSVDAIVHLAGLAHARGNGEAFDRVNAAGTRNLAQQARKAGVKRFVFMSSVKAAADVTSGALLVESDAPAPSTPYGRSKLEAERALLAMDGLLSVILRPPLVHGADAAANFALLLGLAATPLPLPFAATGNRRSLISRDSLIDALTAVLDRPGAAGVFYVADRPALSTGEIIEALRRGMGYGGNLFAAPILAQFAPNVLRESLEIDDSKFRSVFGFQGQDSREALGATAAAWKTRNR